MRVLVVTTVHHPLDARIRDREIAGMLRAGWQVTFVAPAGDGDPPPGLDRVVIPRSAGRKRVAAIAAAGRELRRRSFDADVAIIHDPELLVVAPVARCPVVFDIHEDVSKQVVDKAWLPGVLRPAMAWLLKLVDRRLGSMPLLVAEESYLERHPSAVLVRNSFDFAKLPEPAPAGAARDRIVYLGSVTEPRGALSLDAVAARLPDEISIEVIGPVLGNLTGRLPNLEQRNALAGRQPLADGLGRLKGALAGLCLLQDRPNYRDSVPTKVLEYLACGVPVITTPLPHAVRIVEASGGGVVVDFDDPEAVVAAVKGFAADPSEVERMSARGRRYAKQYFDWAEDEQRLLQFLLEVVRGQHP